MIRTLASTITAGLLCMAAAHAANPVDQHALHPITVQPRQTLPAATWNRPLGDCTPPTDLAACDALHALIRMEFNADERGMLFGAASAHKEYLTSYNATRIRYARFLRDYEAGRYPLALVTR